MTNRSTPFTRALAIALVIALCGAPEAARAWGEPGAPLPDAPSLIAQNTQPAQEQLPDPSLQQTPQSQGSPADSPQNPPAQNSPAQEGQPRTPQSTEPPAGAAGAQAGDVAGGAASTPAGSAIAPTRQREVRSFLIKLGAIAAAGAAVGAVYALSRGTASTPPGAPGR
ncbi:MAG: hypothetical protein AB7O65_10215 [Candidatus Korobacteraceae bacterium]